MGKKPMYGKKKENNESWLKLENNVWLTCWQQNVVEQQKRLKRNRTVLKKTTNKKKEKKEKGSTSSSSSTSHHFPKRLPHMQPRTHRNTTATTTAKHATNTTTTKRTGTLPPMPSFQKKEQSSFSFVNAMETRSLERKQKREERRQRYLAADLQKQWYETWKTQISSVIGPDAARAGRMFLRKRQAKIERQKKTMKKNANLLAKQKKKKKKKKKTNFLRKKKKKKKKKKK